MTQSSDNPSSNARLTPPADTFEPSCTGPGTANNTGEKALGKQPVAAGASEPGTGPGDGGADLGDTENRQPQKSEAVVEAPQEDGTGNWTIPEYVPGSMDPLKDYKTALRAIIDGTVSSSVEPIDGSFTSLVRSLESSLEPVEITRKPKG